MMYLATILMTAHAAVYQGQPEDYNRRLAKLLDRFDRLLEETADEILSKGEVSETRIKLGQKLFDQIAYIYQRLMGEVIEGKRNQTEELARTNALMKDMVKSKDSSGEWLAAAALRRLLPKVKEALDTGRFPSPWSTCDGSEHECVVCDIVKRRGN